MSSRPIQASIRTRPGEPTSLADQLREALSTWASGVAVLAVSDADEIDAITVSAFSAVSMDPPLILVCVSEQSSTVPTVLDEERFTVSILATDQKRLASAIAQRLTGSLSSFRAVDDPVLDGALATFTCRLWNAYPGGDHRIFVGEVERVEVGPEAAPLLYYRREYRKLVQ